MIILFFLKKISCQDLFQKKAAVFKARLRLKGKGECLLTHRWCENEAGGLGGAISTRLSLV